MESIKQINVKNQTYYRSDVIINIKIFDSNLLKTGKKSYKNIDIYCIGYITMKDFVYVNIHSVNTLYFIVDKQMETLKKVLTKYTELWN